MLRSVASFPTRIEAEVVQGLLASAGIESWIAADDAGGAFPVALAGGARVLVEERDLAAAFKVVADKTSMTSTKAEESQKTTGTTLDARGGERQSRRP